MPLKLQQTDTAAADGSIQACSGRATAHSVIATSQITAGGTAGTGHSTTMALSAPLKRLLMFESGANALDTFTWYAGNYVLRLNLTSNYASAGTCLINEIWICRLNSAGVSQATIGSLTGLNQTLDANGVITFTVAGAAQTPAVGDKIYIAVVAGNSDVGGHSGTWTFDQLIDTPLDLSLALSPRFLCPMTGGA